jgi:hypothetical protein
MPFWNFLEHFFFLGARRCFATSLGLVALLSFALVLGCAPASTRNGRDKPPTITDQSTAGDMVLVDGRIDGSTIGFISQNNPREFVVADLKTGEVLRASLPDHFSIVPGRGQFDLSSALRLFALVVVDDRISVWPGTPPSILLVYDFSRGNLRARKSGSAFSYPRFSRDGQRLLYWKDRKVVGVQQEKGLAEIVSLNELNLENMSEAVVLVGNQKIERAEGPAKECLESNAMLPLLLFGGPPFEILPHSDPERVWLQSPGQIFAKYMCDGGRIDVFPDPSLTRNLFDSGLNNVMPLRESFSVDADFIASTRSFPKRNQYMLAFTNGGAQLWFDSNSNELNANSVEAIKNFGALAAAYEHERQVGGFVVLRDVKNSGFSTLLQNRLDALATLPVNSRLTVGAAFDVEAGTVSPLEIRVTSSRSIELKVEE